MGTSGHDEGPTDPTDGRDLMSPPGAPSGHAGRLPLPVTSFVGRRQELTQATRLLRNTRIVTLAGAGGSGKTRLAQQVATGLASDFVDGVRWIDLAPLTDGEFVVPLVAEAVGVREHPGEPLLASLRDRLAESEMVLLIDNCEHLVQASSEVVAALASTCPSLRILATTREPLRVDGETIIRVGSLAVPSPREHSRADELRGIESVRLFVDRAASVAPNFGVTDVNAEAVARICRSLDGMPLAIELAAARIAHLSPEEIADGLADRFTLLRGGPRNSLPRHRTLEASVRWSYELLTATEQRVLERLSVFAGSFGRESAAAVCADGSLDGDTVLDALDSLVDRSLVQTDTTGRRARYRLLETIRLFAAGLLTDHGDEGAVRDRHLAFYLALAERGREGLIEDFPGWQARLSFEIDNLRTAMDRATATADPLGVVRMAEAIFAFWIITGRYAELQRRLRAATASREIEVRDRARGMATGAMLTLMAGDYRAAYEFASGAMSLTDDSNDADTRARSRLMRAWTGYFSGLGNDEQIRDDIERSRVLMETVDDPELRARWGLYAGGLVLNRRSVEQGRATLEGALAVALEQRMTFLEVPIRTFLALAGYGDADIAGGRRHAVIAQRLAGDLGFASFRSLASSAHGWLDAIAGDEPAARRHVEEARVIAQQAGLHAFEMYALRTLAFVEHRFSDPDVARATAERARTAIRRSMGGLDEALVVLIAGIAALREGDAAGAHGWFSEAQEIATDPASPYVRGRALLGLAHLAELDDDLASAWEHAHDALETLVSWGDPVGAADAMEAVAGLAAAAGDCEKGARLLAAADMQRTRTGIARFPFEEDRYPSLVAVMDRGLEGDVLAACWAEGEALSWPEAVAYARRGRGRRGRPPSGWSSLTPSEQDVVRLVSQGLANADVAQRLFVSVNTVKTHLSHVYAKLGLSSRSELVAEAARRHQPG